MVVLAANELGKVAQETEITLKGIMDVSQWSLDDYINDVIVSEVGELGEAGTAISQALKLLGQLSSLLKWLGVVGFVLTIIVGIIEAVQGAEQ